MTINKYQLLGYDVWGNAKHGYEVNNMYNLGEFEINDDMTDTEIVHHIGCNKQVEIDNCISDETTIYFKMKKSGKPLCELRLIQ
jgi:hypothetical protein